jgi:prepilin signal peptidase PulO-like enzyme (type II secretory pathway)
MGAGDVKLAAMLGFGLGWQGIVLVIWVACFVAAIYGMIDIGLGRLQRTSKIPLGFFIGHVAVGYVAAEHWLDNWNIGLMDCWSNKVLEYWNPLIQLSINPAIHQSI